MVVRIRVLQDFGCHPTWVATQDREILANVDPAELGLPASLVGRLQAWAQWGESFINMSDPAHDSRVVSAGEQAAFDTEGRLLTRRVAAERGDAQVWYFNDSPET